LLKKRTTIDSRTGPVRIGIDIGGTFTDLVSQDLGGNSWKVKVSTTPSEPALGALEAVRKFLRDSQVSPQQVSVVVHATTLASNALLTGQLPRVALLTTKGFRDVLEIGRQNRPELYNLQVERLRPLIPRQYRFEVEERISYEGKILIPLNTNLTRKITRRIRRLGIESLAICFLHSYANPRHEQAAATILYREAPQIHVSVSSDLLPEFREYERTSTTVVNACLQPIFSKYLAQLQKGLAELGVNSSLFVMQSNGGTLLSPQAVREPARIIESGPVAGAVASRAYGKKTGAAEIISLDVGGTTAKAGVWLGDRFEVTTEYEVGGRLHGLRPLQGSGYPVKFPVVDLVEVGIGGGSIAQVDHAGVLHVGPNSAGASPGPACYGFGGSQPTLTDANLVLGRLNPQHLLGGELTLHSELAQRAIIDQVARPLGLGVTGAAMGILRIALANISAALKAATVERGRDPRGMTLVAFGGAGPMHACEVARQLEIRRVVIPPAAGLLSSLGLLLAEHVHDFVRTIMGPISDLDYSVIASTFDEMEERGKDLLRTEGIGEKDIVFQRFFDLRYRGQSYELSIPIPWRHPGRQIAKSAARDFHRLHEAKYGQSDPDGAVELVNVRSYCRARAMGVIPKARAISHSDMRPPRYRKVLLDESMKDPCRIFERRIMPPGSAGRGPCVVEDYDSTLVIPSKATYMIDNSGTFLVSL